MGGDKAALGRRSAGVYIRHVEHSRFHYKFLVHCYLHVTPVSLHTGNDDDDGVGGGGDDDDDNDDDDEEDDDDINQINILPIITRKVFL